MTSRLTVGTERIPAKPPRGQPPCTEPYVKGANILKDPGFELHLANTDGGPYGDEIPADHWRNDSGLTQTWYESWSDGTSAPQLAGWASINNMIPYVPSGWLRAGWTVSTANPRSGTYHARTTPMIGYGQTIFGNPGELRPVTVYQCAPATAPPTAIGSYYGWSGRAAAGDFVLFSFWASVTNIPTGSVPRLNNFYIQFFDADGASVSGSLDWSGYGNPTEEAIGLSYKQFSHSVFAPAGTHFFYAAVSFYREDPGDQIPLQFDVDDCVLEVT